MSANTRLVDRALALAEKGYRVFPVIRNTKVPRVKGWIDAATSDAAQIGEWWAKWPDCNPGVATGQGLLVIDLDNKPGRDGLGWWRSMGLVFDTPPTMAVRTPSGGFHLYYTSAIDYRTRGDFPAKGVDLQSARRFVLGPGSVRDNGEYVIVPFEETLA